jgi:Lon-like ATP-dependent protease
VGGVVAKVEAAMRAGAKRVLIPQENWQEIFSQMPLEVIPVRQVKDVLKLSLLPERRAVPPGAARAPRPEGARRGAASRRAPGQVSA